MKIIEIKGRARAMHDDKLYIDTGRDTIIVRIEDDDLRWKLYCNNIKVSLEIIEEEPENN